MSTYIYPASAANYSGPASTPDTDDGGFWSDVWEFASDVGDWFAGDNNLAGDDWYEWLSSGQYIDLIQYVSTKGWNTVTGSNIDWRDPWASVGDILGDTDTDAFDTYSAASDGGSVIF